VRVGDATYSEIQLTIDEMGCSVLQRAEQSKIKHQNGLELSINVEARIRVTGAPKGSYRAHRASHFYNCQWPVSCAID
jgi:hypothetical protein